MNVDADEAQEDLAGLRRSKRARDRSPHLCRDALCVVCLAGSWSLQSALTSAVFHQGTWFLESLSPGAVFPRVDPEAILAVYRGFAGNFETAVEMLTLALAEEREN